GFSLVPSAMWPSVPKIIPEKQLGTAFATIFWVQNWGLMGIPFAVGVVLDKLNPGVAAAISAGEAVKYDYTKTWLIFIALTVLAVVFAFLLKAEDKKKGYGLQLPNIK
ncbi:MAG: MFS transporter, partial [Candidatus Aminicenantes bacterium]|nr:MFS transporter [Candidatus Aminicenantes bacterium]